MGNPIEPRNVCGVELPAPLPIEPRATAKTTAPSTVSPTTQTKPTTASFTKPTLPSPTKKPRGIHKSMADFVNGIERTRQNGIRSGLKRLETLSLEHTHMQEKKTAEIIKNADELIREDSWTYYKDIARCLSTTTSVLMGGALTASGNPWGGVLIASGLTSFVTQTMEKTNDGMPITGALAIAAAGIGSVYGTGAITEYGQLYAILQSSLSLASATTALGVEEAKTQREYITKELSRIQNALGVAEKDTQKITQEIGESARRVDAAADVSDSMRDYQRVVAQIAASSAA